RAKIVCMRDDIERRGVGTRPRVFVIGEPMDERGRLRNLMRDFAVGALEFFEKLKRGARRLKIADGVERETRPECIAPEEPCEARSLRLARRAIACDETCAERRVCHHTF